ncbi:MAG TPA: autotransporter domain-containing protein [Casimicrobiaceae bacterium]|jgi:outer membrane lipase/esterase|nr:autotransporter domain-containing protein [Casimicrobiaceae bacterium]
MRTVTKSIWAAVWAIGLCLANGPAAAQFNQFYFFGDSLSDAGSFKPVLPPGTGKFTTNPGPIWAEVLAQRYGSTATPANQGGNDFAEGGARVTQLPGVPATPPTGTATPVAVQVQHFLARGAVDPKALYSVWAGANDLFFQLGLAQAGLITPTDVQTNVATAAVQVVQQVGILNAAGARYIMVFNLPDVGSTPFGRSSGQAASITALSSFFNSTLSTGLDALHIDVIRLNVFSLLDEVVANPAAYGFINATSPACTVPSLVCTSSTLVAPNAAQTYVFADSVHPTTATHQVIADYAASVLEAPQKIGLLAEAPLHVEQANFRAIDNRMWSSLNAPRAQNKFNAYAVYDYGNYDHSGDFGGGSDHLNTVTVGGDMKLSEQLLAGIAFGYSEDKASFGDNGGGYTLNEASLTAYVGYGQGPWYVGATVGAGDLDFRNIHRTFALGAGSRTETGDTHGTNVMARLLGGYWFNTTANWLHGPFALLTYQQNKVYAWSEEGTSSTAMSFGHQQRDSLISSLGWQASGTFGSLRPFGRVTWEKEYDNGERTVRAGLVSTGGIGFGLPALRTDDSYVLFEIGASVDLGSRLIGFASINATASKDDGNYQAVTLGVRLPL